MNSKIERIRDEIRRTEAKQREVTEYLKTLKIREKQLCDEELIKVMRSMAGKNGDVMKLLDKFQESGEQETVEDTVPAPFISERIEKRESEVEIDED